MLLTDYSTITSDTAQGPLQPSNEPAEIQEGMHAVSLSPAAISLARESLSSSTADVWKLTGYTHPCPISQFDNSMPKKANLQERGRGGTTCPPEELNLYTNDTSAPRNNLDVDESASGLPAWLARGFTSYATELTLIIYVVKPATFPRLPRVCLMPLAILRQVFLCVCTPARWRRADRFESRLVSPSRHDFKRRTASCRRDCSWITSSLNKTQRKDDVLCAYHSSTVRTWYLGQPFYTRFTVPLLVLCGQQSVLCPNRRTPRARARFL